MTYIDKSKFKTQIGCELYELLKSVAPHEDWIFLMLMLVKGDKNRKMVVDFIKDGQKTSKEINDFIVENWG